MSDLVDLLVPAAVAERMVVSGRKALFQQLGALMAQAWELNAAAVVEGLTEREKLGSTAVGGGIAIPHARLAGLDHIVGGVARLAPAVPLDAPDDLPVELVFVLLSPADAGAEHLKALARVSRALRDRNLVAKLRGAGSRDALFALLAGDHGRDAA